MSALVAQEPKGTVQQGYLNPRGGCSNSNYGLVPFPGHSNNAAGIIQASVGIPPMTQYSTSVVESPQLFHKILGVALFVLSCCAQGKPAGNPPLPSFRHLTVDGIDEGFIPGFRPLVDNEMEDIIHQLEHRISRLEGDRRNTLKKCEEAGGSIAIPRNLGKNDAILYFVRSFNTYTYVGIQESLTPRKFQFLELCTQLSYTNWHLNEPSGKGEEERVETYTDGTWNDKRCNKNPLVVCQF
ncbi:LOW QUALITY PROTEIN: pulmonary surfactant-associated protein A-like [Cariama cristata]